MRKLVKISLVIPIMFSLLGITACKNNESQKSVYHVDEIVSSLEKAEIVVEMLETNVTANEILSDSQYILTYRPDDGVKEFPENVSPTKVKVDINGTFLLYYSDKESYLADYAYLKDKEETIFVCEITNDDIHIDDDYKDINAAHNTTSYGPSLMNSEEFAAQVADSDRELTVVVMDTGLYSNNSVVAQYFNLKDSYDFCNDDPNVFDGIDDHATYVSSTILETMGEEVTSKINLINAKVLENGRGYLYNAYNAILHYADLGVDIINCSFSAGSDWDMMGYAVEYATSKGVILICSSGNGSSYVAYPAAYEGAIAVSAVDKNKNIAYFSNTGKEVEFCGPGVRMMEYGPENIMSPVSGTSFSAPALTGFSIMVMLDDESVDTRDELVEKLRGYCVDLGESGRDDKYGYGLPVYYKTPEPPVEEEPTPEIETPTEETCPPEEETPTEETCPPEEETPTEETCPPEEETPTEEPSTPEEETPSEEPSTPEKETPTEETCPPEEETPEVKKIMVYFDANGGSSSVSSKEYEKESKYGILPDVTRDYYKFEGWYTAAEGGIKINSDTELIKNDTHTLYAHWVAKNESGWTKYDEIPKGAKVTQTKYTYTFTSYTTSAEPSLSGWTLYDKKSEWGNYGSWSEWSTNKVTDSDSRKVETKEEPYTYNTGRKLFNYSHYKYWNTTYNAWYYTYSHEAAAMHGNNIVYEELGWSTTELFLNTKFGNSNQSYGTRVNGIPWFNEVVKEETATGYTTYYRYADRTMVTTYYYKKIEERETLNDPSGQNGVSNVVKYVKYIEK